MGCIRGYRARRLDWLNPQANFPRFLRSHRNHNRDKRRFDRVLAIIREGLPATSTVRSETLLATEVVDSPSTPPSTTVATPATLVASRRRQTKQRQSRKPVTRRSIDWKLVGFVFYPLHARFNFTLEGCANDDGLNSHGELPHCSPSDSILGRDLSGERVFINPPEELAEQIA
jgi:hypothetical protein